MIRSREGIVLPVVLMVLLVVELLAAGTLALAYQQHSLARERSFALRAQLAARSGVADLASHWTGGQYQSVPPGTRTAVLSRLLDAQSRYSTELERLTPSLFLVRAIGQAGPAAAGARAAAGRLIAVADISAMAAQFEGAFTSVGGVRLAGAASVTAVSSSLPPFGWSASECSTWLPLPVTSPGLVIADATTVVAPPAALIAGTPPVLEQSALAGQPPDMLGSFDFPALNAIADRVESGTVDLTPVAVAGDCTESAPGNWGAPLDQAHPCAGYFPLIFSGGSLTITGGAGQGVLIVDGDLTLASGVQFFGVVLVRGRVVAERNAEITGAAQAASGPSLLTDASIVRSSCALSRALSRAPALNRALARALRASIPLY